MREREVQEERRPTRGGSCAGFRGLACVWIEVWWDPAGCGGGGGYMGHSNVQGCVTYKNTHPPKTLPQAYD